MGQPASLKRVTGRSRRDSFGLVDPNGKDVHPLPG
jgi:hypothetical protein